MKSGKTTLATALCRETGCYRFAFADPIREALKILGIEKDTHPELYRKGAQYIGTDLVRAYDNNWWVNLLEYRITNQVYTESFVIDDMRFQNEYEWCRDNGFCLVRLDITPEEQVRRGAEWGTFTHPSETGLDHIKRNEWDIWLPQDTTVQERVSTIMEAMDSHYPIRVNG